MKAKYNGTCKVTGLPIIANVTEITKIDGVWQVANTQPVQQAQAQAKQMAKAVNLDERLTSGKWSGYSPRDLARSFVGREYLEWAMMKHPSATTRKVCEYALNNVNVDIDDYEFQFEMTQKGHSQNEISWNPTATANYIASQKKSYLHESKSTATTKYGDDFLEDDETEKTVMKSYDLSKYL